ncbi:hypothetical protein [Nitratiruptor sp. YY09-18]|uniref:hypothetical protein n=1 Tax=Nitratiruptor sp. YY09-18 TaxID=2724901 RepID=UPI001915B246|nr:hypothetical protein [Nitratiruptor sp. YY09-18]
MNYKLFFLIIVIFPFAIIIFLEDDNLDYKNTRKIFSSQRRISLINHTSIAKKNLYIKEAISNLTNNKDIINIGTVAYEMNKLEKNYRLPYNWGGDIKNFKKGFDCTGFIHGIMYYLGFNSYLKRFNTFSLYKKLLYDKNFHLIYVSKNNSLNSFDIKNLKIGDIVIWPSGIKDAKNLPNGKIFGHIGVVSYIEKDGIPYVTHYVRSKAYNNIDIFPIKGPGINTLKADKFISLKQRGILNIFRFENSR